ncbi:Rieske 2Fe-2S family protein [Fonsecaea pedrosoi]|nr:Rieske 2Fe-2S family protein [Fonsecaea pedrosoi]
MPAQKAPERRQTFPASWYTEPAFYEFERRAIFSQSWLLISHKLRFGAAGTYVRYEVAGIPFMLIKDRQGEIRAFLNICRHRAFPLVHQDEGKVSILACKYHGWSYGLNGNLAKAPRFDSVEDFDKKEYSLFQVHVHLDVRGFIWVNLDAAETPTVSWDEQFGGVDTQPRLSNFDMDDYEYNHTWGMEGKFNWKTLIENYNECYHCPTAHPGLAPFIAQKQLVYGCERYYIKHMGNAEEDRSAFVSPTYMFPNSSVTMTQEFFYMMQIVPTSATTSTMRYEVYRRKGIDPAKLEKELDFYSQVEGEDKWLANGAQGNLNSGAFVTGPLHPDLEAGVSYTESIIREMLLKHAEREKVAGKQIWPAKRSASGSQLEEDEAFCKGICDGAGGADAVKLAW